MTSNRFSLFRWARLARSVAMCKGETWARINSRSVFSVTFMTMSHARLIAVGEHGMNSGSLILARPECEIKRLLRLTKAPKPKTQNTITRLTVNYNHCSNSLGRRSESLCGPEPGNGTCVDRFLHVDEIQWTCVCPLALFELPNCAAIQSLKSGYLLA